MKRANPRTIRRAASLAALFLISLVAWGSPRGRALGQSPTGSDSPDRLLEQAVEAFGDRDYDKAALVLEQATQRFPDNVELMYWQGMTYLRQSRWEEAQAALRRVCELEPGNALAHEKLGDAFAHARQHAQAVRCYEKALSFVPGSAENKELKQKLAEARRLMEHPDDAAAAMPPSDEDSVTPAEGASPSGSTTSLPKAAPANESSSIRDGFVGWLSLERQVYGNIAAIVALLLAPIIVHSICIKGFRLPLTLTELRKTAILCALTVAVGYLLAWGYAPHWRMWLAGPYVIVVGIVSFRVAKARSIVAFMEGMRVLAAVLERAKKNQ